MLGLPAEAANPPLAGRGVDDDPGTPGHTIAIPIKGILEARDGLVRNGFDQSRAKKGNGRTSSNYVHVVRNQRLAFMSWYREQMDEGISIRVQASKRSVRILVAGASLGHESAPADRRYAVTHRATGAVERGAESFLCRLDFGEIIESEPKLFELAWGQPWQWLARQQLPALAVDDPRVDTNSHHPQQRGGCEHHASPHRLSPPARG